MSGVLDNILALSADEHPRTVTLSADSVAVLLYASGLLEKQETWIDRENYPGDEVSDVDWDAIEKMTGNLMYELMTEVEIVAQVFPIKAEINPMLMLWSILAGNVTPFGSDTPYGMFTLQSSASNGDSCKTNFHLAAGEYVLELWYARSTANGKIDVYLDGVEVVTQEDLFLGTGTVKKVYAVNVLTSGNHLVQVVCNGKNTSSSGYQMRLASISFWTN